MNATALAVAPPIAPEPPTYDQLEAAYRKTSEEYLAALRAKKLEEALHAESHLFDLAFAMERERFGWSVR